MGMSSSQLTNSYFSEGLVETINQVNIRGTQHLVILVVLMGIESPKEPAEFLFLQGI
jgi:hypothetical protein